MYDPSHPDFRKYMTREEWVAQHAPLPEDYALVKGWLEDRGFQINFEASNRLLLQFTGTAEQFEQAFQSPLHVCMRENPAHGGEPFPVYCLLGPVVLPRVIAERIHGVITGDLPAEEGMLSTEGGEITTTPPDNVAEGYVAAQIARAYGLDELYAAGYTGQGVNLGVVVGATFRFRDLQSFWQTLGITRPDPVVVQTMEPIVTRYRETTLDVEWSAAMAPGANVIVYEGPDARNTSMVYAFNEAIARNEVSVITNSFAHREDSEPTLVRHQYSEAAMMAAALGITVVVASGDSARTDTPSASPYVTCVGGTDMVIDETGVVSEIAWHNSGSGKSFSFALPYWQEALLAQGIIDSETRVVSDVALHASVDTTSYWIVYLREWKRYGGTSFAAPVFGGLMATVNSYRVANGLPVVGYLNPILYQDANVQATFRDIAEGKTDLFDAGPGWDYPTGWGAPHAMDLAQALP